MRTFKILEPYYLKYKHYILVYAYISILSLILGIIQPIKRCTNYSILSRLFFAYSIGCYISEPRFQDLKLPGEHGEPGEPGEPGELQGENQF